MGFSRTSRNALVATLVGIFCAGCVLMEVRRQQELDQLIIRLSGSVSAVEPGEGLLVVVLVRRPGPEGGESEIIDHYTLNRDGRFYFSVAEPGTYAVAAFHDRNRNLVYDLDEPARVADEQTTFELAEGETREGIQIEIHPDQRARVDGPLDIRTLQIRSVRDQQGITMGQLTVAGDVVDLSDSRFGPKSGELGLWRPVDFLYDVGAGIYFLQEYDPKRIPVLFVHGVSGHPQSFSDLIDHLDVNRFQPWFYFYPSGASLPEIAAHLSQVVVELQAQHDFERLFVVGHSMGGLVSRGFLLYHDEVTEEEYLPLFVSISTPWGGQAAAQTGIDHSPAVVYSWIDVAPGSEYLRRIFFRDPETLEQRLRLPDHMSYHLIFGFQRNARLPGESSDKVITLASQLRLEAQEEAGTVFGVDASHVGILSRPETIKRLNAILENAADRH
jgi:pimeloyl-ACP methyl ester carboxylesterase